jgi:hypothetical protein
VNPKPSLYQCLVLHELADGKVCWRGGDWWVTGSRRDHKVTRQMNKLIELDYVQRIVAMEDPSQVFITLKGLEVLRRRTYFDLVEQLNSARK